jgi:hypothetical protein
MGDPPPKEEKRARPDFFGWDAMRKSAKANVLQLMASKHFNTMMSLGQRRASNGDR